MSEGDESLDILNGFSMPFIRDNEIITDANIVLKKVNSDLRNNHDVNSSPE